MASINTASQSKKKAIEPSEYVGMQKICKRCKQSNVKFKFLNNKKQNQPRYQCLDCTLELGKPYHFNPFPIREHNHRDGYAKLSKVETEELKNLKKVCDFCRAENNATFRGYNNGKINQPRYACKVCKHLFSPLKNSKATSSNIDVPPYEFQTIEAQNQETGFFQQPSGIDVPPYEFQTIEANYQETSALQQPSQIEAQYQDTGTSQQPLPYNTSYEQTSISYQQCNHYNPCDQSSDNNLFSTMDVDGSSNQFPIPSQNIEAWQWQQPSLYDTLFDQTSISSQQHNYHYPNNQSSENHSLASLDVGGYFHESDSELMSLLENFIT